MIDVGQRYDDDDDEVLIRRPCFSDTQRRLIPDIRPLSTEHHYCRICEVDCCCISCANSTITTATLFTQLTRSDIGETMYTAVHRIGVMTFAFIMYGIKKQHV